MAQTFIRMTLLAALAGVQLLAGSAPGWRFARTEAGLRTLTTQGQAQTPAGPADGSLNLFCKEGEGGWIGLEFTVFKADEAAPGDFIQAIKGFHFDDFEGPGAPASSRRLTRLECRGRGGDCRIQVRQAGSYSSALSGGFEFSTGVPNTAAGSDLRRLLAALGKAGGDRLTVTVTDTRDPKAAIQGEFNTSAPGLAGLVQQLLKGY